MNETGWFADIDPERAHDSSFLWRPFLQLRGHVAPVEVWFASEADCMTFIRDDILGQGVLP